MYESFFGLTGLPFQLNPDPTFLFQGKGHEDAFAALQRGLAAGARVIVVTGEVGAGKTTLLQALLSTVDPASTVTAHISASGLDAEMLTDRLCGCLSQPPLPDFFARRDALLSRLRLGPLATLLVIDEAQHLEASAFELLEMMADAGVTAPARLQICLVGQPELRILINAPERSGFRELIDVDRHLRPLEQTEIRLYVEHRLHRAGWTGKPEFEDGAFFEIFVFTGGIPRRVNLLCNSLMLSAWLKRQERIDAPAVTSAAAAIRGDSFQGAPDLPEVEPHYNDPPTLTEAIEPEAPAPHDARLNSLAPPSEGCLQWHADTSADAATTDPTTAHGDDNTTAREDDLPALTMSDGTPQADRADSQLINARLAGLVHQAESAPRRRRQAIMAGVAFVAVAAATIIYVVDQRRSQTGLSKIELPDVVAKRTAAPPSAGPARDLTASSTSSLPAGASSPEPSSPPASIRSDLKRATESGDRVNSQIQPTAKEPDAAEALPALPSAVNPAPPDSRSAPSCSDPASALGLCDAEISSSTRRP